MGVSLGMEAKVAEVLNPLPVIALGSFRVHGVDVELQRRCGVAVEVVYG